MSPTKDPSKDDKPLKQSVSAPPSQPTEDRNDDDSKKIKNSAAGKSTTEPKKKVKEKVQNEKSKSKKNTEVLEDKNDDDSKKNTNNATGKSTTEPLNTDTKNGRNKNPNAANQNNPAMLENNKRPILSDKNPQETCVSIRKNCPDIPPSIHTGCYMSVMGYVVSNSHGDKPKLLSLMDSALVIHSLRGGKRMNASDNSLKLDVEKDEKRFLPRSISLKGLSCVYRQDDYITTHSVCDMSVDSGNSYNTNDSMLGASKCSDLDLELSSNMHLMATFVLCFDGRSPNTGLTVISAYEKTDRKKGKVQAPIVLRVPLSDGDRFEYCLRSIYRSINRRPDDISPVDKQRVVKEANSRVEKKVELKAKLSAREKYRDEDEELSATERKYMVMAELREMAIREKNAAASSILGLPIIGKPGSDIKFPLIVCNPFSADQRQILLAKENIEREKIRHQRSKSPEDDIRGKVADLKKKKLNKILNEEMQKNKAQNPDENRFSTLNRIMTKEGLEAAMKDITVSEREFEQEYGHSVSLHGFLEAQSMFINDNPMLKYPVDIRIEKKLLGIDSSGIGRSFRRAMQHPLNPSVAEDQMRIKKALDYREREIDAPVKKRVVDFLGVACPELLRNKRHIRGIDGWTYDPYLHVDTLVSYYRGKEKSLFDNLMGEVKKRVEEQECCMYFESKNLLEEERILRREIEEQAMEEASSFESWKSDEERVKRSVSQTAIQTEPVTLQEESNDKTDSFISKEDPNPYNISTKDYRDNSPGVDLSSVRRCTPREIGDFSLSNAAKGKGLLASEWVGPTPSDNIYNMSDLPFYTPSFLLPYNPLTSSDIMKETFESSNYIPPDNEPSKDTLRGLGESHISKLGRSAASTTNKGLFDASTNRLTQCFSLGCNFGKGNINRYGVNHRSIQKVDDYASQYITGDSYIEYEGSRSAYGGSYNKRSNKFLSTGDIVDDLIEMERFNYNSYCKDDDDDSTEDSDISAKGKLLTSDSFSSDESTVSIWSGMY